MSRVRSHLGLTVSAMLVAAPPALAADPAAARGAPAAAQVAAPSESAGARELSPMAMRSWGDAAAYSLDPDGHVLAVGAAAASA